ncbi:DUF1800 domain-containing protein [Erythrobacter sp. SDW2]|uniref:DUF1800 domain-containing protein n=1 Tax=Erythrobacter sp. SDW2 TaxID=2907154 RepID=UPI001F2A7481|nr:DUF1800 domain-containing protein [Erythrobacter sp. SDW2]UIP06251.1 DUF1800 domain-containing protein [Erythrobacter sp. SDW2]
MSAIATALNRFGLGGKGGEQPPADARRWLLDQLRRFDPAPSVIRARPTGVQTVKRLVQYRADLDRARKLAGAAFSPGEPTERTRAILLEYNESGRASYIDDVLARGQVAVASETPFVERLVHFWANHFTTSMAKLQAIAFVGPHEFEAIRPHVLGDFRGLLRAAVLHPAMLTYLDQPQSVGPTSFAATSRKKREGVQSGLNENLAREIMELHTLGSDGGYNQADVTEFARALTGITYSGLATIRNASDLGNGSAFAPDLHEPGVRVVMGRRYPQQGKDQALAMLDEFARHPATARHIATKLARHFAADDPPAALVARLEKAFLASDGDLPTVYRALVDAPESWSLGQRKFRTPWEWTIGAMRAIGTPPTEARRFQVLLDQLGQPVWAAPSPLGYADRASNWAAPDALVRRIEVADKMAQSIVPPKAIDLARDLFPDALNDSTTTALTGAASPTQALALLLASPEMMRR